MSILTKNESLAGWWHLAIAVLYVGAMIFHVLSAVEHWQNETKVGGSE